MLLNKPTSKTLRKLLSPHQKSIFSCLYQPQNPAYIYTQKSGYVNVYMKWKKDSYFDNIEHIDKSIVLKPIINLKNCITEDPKGCIPIYQVSKKGFALDVPMKVATFLRKFPSIFEEFSGEYNYPWFRLTPEAAEIDREEKRVYEDCREDLRDRLKKLILMSKEKVLPLKIIEGMEWYLGLPEDFLHYPEKNLDGSFRFVTMEDGLEGLAVDSGEEFLSVVQRNAMKKGVYFGGSMEAIGFPLYPSKDLRLRNEFEDWFKEFQKLPYVSPYEDFSHLQPDTDASEKRVVGLLHELLSLFVEHSAERKKIKCLKKYLGLPQKLHRAFERHPEIFYLSYRNKTCMSILKEAYCDESAIEKHPLLEVRKKYIRLMRESAVILKNRRVNGRLAGRGNKELDLEPKIEDRGNRESMKVDLNSESENVDQRDGGNSNLDLGSDSGYVDRRDGECSQ